MRIGNGFDIHQFAQGRKLILGGVEIPHPRGLHGHSDADPLSHAIVDAILGAAGLGDIGTHFPDTDPQWKNVSSQVFLKGAAGLIAEHGFKIVNVDSVVLAEEPKISPYREEMREIVAGSLGIAADQVSIKATTMEKTGAIGRREAIAAQAVALIEEV